MRKNYNIYNIFSSIARRYDLINTVISFNVDKGWRKKTIALCNLNKNDKALDLCCGTGQMMDYICKDVGKYTKVIGLDFNEEMIDEGNKRLNHTLEGYNFELVKGNIIDLPFEDSQFDCVTIAFGLRNAPDLDKALSEIYRVLKPGGKLACLELSNPENSVFKKFYGIYFNYILPVVGFIGTGSKPAYFYLRDSVNRFLSKDELKSKFSSIGFEDAGYVPLTGGVAAIHYGRKE